MPSHKLLISDPDVAQLDRYRRYFNHGAWFLATATNGLECVAQLRDFRPDVLVLEPEMPWGGGSGVLGCLRDDPGIANIPVIVLTKGSDTDELSRVLEFTLDDFLVKPISIEGLAKRIRTVLETR